MIDTPPDQLPWLQEGDRVYHKRIPGRLGHYVGDCQRDDAIFIQWDHDTGPVPVLKQHIGALPEHNRSNIGPLYLRPREWVRDKHVASRLGLVLECDDSRHAAYVEWRGEGICRWRGYESLRRLDPEDENP